MLELFIILTIVFALCSAYFYVEFRKEKKRIKIDRTNLGEFTRDSMVDFYQNLVKEFKSNPDGLLLFTKWLREEYISSLMSLQETKNISQSDFIKGSCSSYLKAFNMLGSARLESIKDIKN